MRYSKIIKLASYFKNKDLEIYSDILKLAYSDKFLSMVLGSYPSRGGSENEMTMRKKIVKKMIDDPSDRDSSISELAKIINETSDIKSEDHFSIWSGTLSKEQLAELKKLLSPAQESSTEYGNSNQEIDPYISWLFAKLNGAKRYHDSVKLAIEGLSSVEWNIPRSSGALSLGRLEAYNPVTKEGRFVVGSDERGWRSTKDLGLAEVFRFNLNKSRSEIAPLQWLLESYIFPLSIPKSSGGTYGGCLLTDLRIEGNLIICNFEFVNDEFYTGTKEIEIDPGFAPYFYQMNKAALDSF